MEDLIRREDALYALCDPPCEECFSGGCELYQRIKSLPSAESNADQRIQRVGSVDAISRQAAIDIVRFECGEWRGLAKTIENGLNDLPSAEPKTGRWMDAEIPLESGGAMPIQVCDQCSTFYPLAHTGGGYHFCPHCGAEMLNAEGDGGAEWVETSGGEHYKCSNCGFLAPYYLSTDREPCEWLSDFCPNCGKLMWRDNE